jgi:flavin-dependent dehydrogenase
VRDAVRDVRVDAERAHVVLESGAALSAAVVVGADGPRSITRHRLELDRGGPRRPRYALRRHFRLADDRALPDRVEVHVGGGHELYVTPVEGDVVGGAALCEKSVMAGEGGRPDERLRALIDSCAPLAERLRGATPVSEALACGPLRVRASRVWRGRAVLIGDAAGYVDAITGEGMSLALKTAALAATATIAVVGGEHPDRAFATYARQRARAFMDHALLTHGLVWLARHPTFARRAIARLAREPALFSRLLAVNAGQRSLASLGFFDALKLAVGASPTP